MSGDKRVEAPLTEQQRRLVRDNIGLVGVHLRRHVRNLSAPQRDREWEDLFQEGCMGLMRAAVAYRETSGIPFAAFALPRIHNAVSRALCTKFSTIAAPARRARGHAAKRGIHGACDTSQPAKVYSLSGELERRLPANSRRHGVDAESGTEMETIGDRLRSKYDRAVRDVSEALSAGASTRGDRAGLVRLLTEERLLVPDEDSRRALRQIARDTRSSFARVAQCDKQLSTAVRGVLEGDPEFSELHRRIRHDPHGTCVTIDEGLERELASACAGEFVRRFRGAAIADRARMLDAFLQMPGGDICDVLRTRVARLSSHQRERLLRLTKP